MTDALALYIHWPFCLAKCPYCDFNSHVRDSIPQARFAQALRTELAWEAARLGRRRLGSIFFGGGTPSLIRPETVAELIADARRLFDAEDSIEITLEANPTSVEAARLAAFRDAGVNRVSIGVQSLDPVALAMLGRAHSVTQAIAALELARALFPRVSFDLIYARPGQTAAGMAGGVAARARSRGGSPVAVSAHHRAGDAFEARHRRGDLVLPNPDEAATLYEATAEEAARFGLAVYEVSNYARPGAESRHNLAYWRYGDYAGIGPGAHGRITLDGGSRNPPAPRARALGRARRSDGHGTTDEQAVEGRDRAREMLLMNFRLSEGVSETRFASRTGLSLDDAIDARVLRDAVEENYLERNDGILRATASGRLRLDALLGALVI